MAMANEINITIHGKSSHGAMPQEGVDANIILSSLLLDFHHIQTRIISPMEPSIITFGRIEGGRVRNQISALARMEGTIRSFSTEVQTKIISSIKRYALQYEVTHECKIDVDVVDGYLPVINDEHLYQEFKDALSSFAFHEFKEPLMIAEDFSFYQDAVPGVFFYLGTKNTKKNYIHPLHHSQFNFDSAVLITGVDAYITLSKKLGILYV